MKKQTQVVRVLTALRDGCRTSVEIADVAELPNVKCASAYLYSLHRKDCIERTGIVRFHDHAGVKPFTYKLLPHGEAELRRLKTKGRAR